MVGGSEGEPFRSWKHNGVFWQVTLKGNGPARRLAIGDAIKPVTRGVRFDGPESRFYPLDHLPSDIDAVSDSELATWLRASRKL